MTDTTSHPLVVQAEWLGIIGVLAKLGSSERPEALLATLQSLPEGRLTDVAQADGGVLSSCVSKATMSAARAGVERVTDGDLSARANDDMQLELMVVDEALIGLERGAEEEPAPALSPPALVHLAEDGLIIPCIPRDAAVGHPWGKDVTMGSLGDRVEAAVAEVLGRFPATQRQPLSPIPDLSVLWPGPASLSAELIGVQVALQAIAAATGLSAQDAPLLALGALGQDGLAVPLDTELRDEAVTGRWPGFDVLLPERRGWVLLKADGAVVSGEDHSLGWDAAMRLVWGNRWDSWLRSAHEAELAQLGWRLMPSELPRPDAALPDIEVWQVAKLRGLLGRRALVLGGPARSGKSTIVRLLAKKLHERSTKNRKATEAGPGPADARPHVKPPEMWDIAVVASLTHELPERPTLLQVGQHALALTKTGEATRKLLVFEDLYPTGEGDVDDVLLYVSARLAADVLAVIEFDSNAHSWKTDRVPVVTAVVGVQSLKRFVELVGAKHPLANRAAGLAAIEGEPSVRDLHSLTNLMTREGPSVSRDQLGAEVEARTGQLTLAELRTVAGVAAASLVRIPVPDAFVAELAEEVMISVGMSKDPVSGSYKIWDSEASRALLRAWQRRCAAADASGAPEAERHTSLIQPIASLLYEEFIGPLLASGADGLVQQLACIRLYDDRVSRELLSRARQELGEWIRSVGSSAAAARLLLRLDAGLAENHARQVFGRLVEEAERSSPIDSTDDALTIARCVHRQRAFLLPGSEEDVCRWLGRQAERLLRRHDGPPHQRLALLDVLERLHDPQLDETIANLTVEVVDSVDPEDVEDYYLVLRVRALQRRATRFLDEEVLVFPIGQETGVLELVNRKLDTLTPFEIIVGQMLVRREHARTDWDSMLVDNRSLLVSSVRRTRAPAFAESLNQLHRANPLYCNALLKRAMLEDRTSFISGIRALLNSSTAVEAAALIQALASSHGLCARDVLFDSGGPNQNLARHLVDPSSREPKGIGMLLSAVQQVDDAYATTHTFGGALGQALGSRWVLETLANDPRPSVKYYLMKGVWEANLPVREESLDITAEVVADDMRHASTEWAARLALRIVEVDSLGERLLEELRDLLSPDDVLRCMTSAPTGALGSYHRLGRLLFPETCDLYAAMVVPQDVAGSIGAARGTAVADLCLEVARTMSDAGQASAGRQLLELVAGAEDPAAAWADRLAATGTGGEFVQLVSALEHIDAALVRRSLEKLEGRMRGRRHGRSPARVLTLLIRRAMYDDATSAAHMLAAVHRIGAMGATIYEELKSQHRHAVMVFTAELRLLHPPNRLYPAAHAMASIGVDSMQQSASWIQPEFTKELVPQFAGPGALLDILRTITLWSPDVGHQAVDRVDMPRLTRRLEWGGRRRDPDDAVDLAALYWQVGYGGRAIEVLDAVASRGVPGICEELSDGAKIKFIRLGRIHRALLREAAPHLMSASLSALHRTPVADVQKALASAGHVAYALHREGLDYREEMDRHGLLTSSRSMHRPGWLAWCLHWLRRSPAVQEVYDSAVSRLYSSQRACAAEPFPALALAASARSAGSVAIAPDVVERMSFRQLVVLHELASDDQQLTEMLRGVTGSIDERVAAPHARADFGAWELRDMRQTARLARLSESG